MKLEIPFHKQPGKYDCGYTSLRMVLDYFGENHEKNQIQELAGERFTRGALAIGIALAANKLGFQTEYYTADFGIGSRTSRVIEKRGERLDRATVEVQRILTEYMELKGRAEERIVPLDEILGKISSNCVPMVSIKNKPTHMVVIVGYNNDEVCVHDPDRGPFQRWEKETFEDFRRVADWDAIFVYKKNNHTR
ncbi:MAG: peptidase C39 family protein [Methanomicrobia archaeon]|nr:peptidase C39 family protein [Methanomicrobia archaeon]